MKNLNMIISILFIMFIANCMGMKVLPLQNDSPKAGETRENTSNFELKNPINLDSLNLMSPKEKIYTNDIAVSKLKILFQYIYSENLDGFKSLLLKSPELKLMTDSKKNNALMVAAYYGQNSFIEYLLDKRELYSMNLYDMNQKGENPFIIACKQNNLDTAEYILNNLPNDFPNGRLVKYSLEEGLNIITKLNENSYQHERITKLINEKLSLH